MKLDFTALHNLPENGQTQTGQEAPPVQEEKEEVRAILKPAQAKDIPLEQKIFSEAWVMLKAYYNIEAWENDEEWDEVVKRANSLYELGKGSPHTEALAKSLTLGVLEYLELISKDKGDKEACIAKRMAQLEEEERKRGK